MNNICMHCLEEGDWKDEDRCPKCTSDGHTNPWQVSKCVACNNVFFSKMKELKDKINKRNIN